MTASAIFAKAALDIFDHLGVPVIYSPVAGTPVENIQALISSSLQLQPSGMSSETWDQHITVELLLAELPGGEPAPGDTVEELIPPALTGGVWTPSGTIYTLVAPLENNGVLVKWVVK